MTNIKKAVSFISSLWFEIKMKSSKGRLNLALELAAVKNILSREADGAALLKLAKEKHIPIVYKARLDRGLAVYDDASKTISVKYSLDISDAVRSLPHELRHMQQYCSFDSDALLNVSPLDQIVITRILEGDAYAFGDIFYYKLLKKDPDSCPSMKEGFIAYQASDRFHGEDNDRVEMLGDLARLSDDVVHGFSSMLETTPEKSRRSPEQQKTIEKNFQDYDRAPIKQLFNACAAPQKLDDGLLEMLREGATPDSPKYLDVQNMQELSDLIVSYIPAETLEKVKALTEKVCANEAKIDSLRSQI